MEDFLQLEMWFTDEQRYDKWKARVNEICLEAFGLDVESLPDFTWRRAYDHGITPWNAIDEATRSWSPDVEALWEEHIVAGVPV
tara:strand:+ start:729 stop:980 length:252 start_codon:yes stop_codon:yes gene_type:complete